MLKRFNLIKQYTCPILFLSLLATFPYISRSDENVEQLKTALTAIKKIEPSVQDSCTQQKTKRQKEESISTKVVDTLFSFISSKNSSQPVQFFLFARTGINPDGSPKYTPMTKQRSDVRALDSFLRGQTSGSKTILSMTDSELDSFFSNNTLLTATEQEDAKIILKMTSHNSESDILRELKELTKGFSYERKLQLLASIGNNLLGGYDKKRTEKATVNSKGVVTTEKMFEAMRRSLITGNKIDAGVCRDMHLSMAKMARAMGLKNAYGVTYSTRNSGHLILTTTPESYGKVSTINYGRIEHSKGVSGAGALELQGGMPSWSMALYITNGTSNKDVIAIPTRLGQAISVASGAEVDSLFFGAQDNGNVLRTGVRSDYGDIIFSRQELTDGTPGEVSGVFYHLKKKPFSFLDLNTAIGYVESEREAGEENLYESGMYFRASTTLGQRIPLTEKLSLKPFITHHHAYLSSCRRTDSNPDCVEDDLTLSKEDRKRPTSHTTNVVAGADISYKDDDLTAKLGYQLRLQNLLEDARDSDSKRSFRPSQHKFSLNVDYLSKDFNLGGHASLILHDLQDQVVKTYQSGAHITYNPLELTVMGEAQGRIDTPGRVAPAWIPGTENRQNFKLLKGFDSIDSSFGIEYQRSDDFPALDSGFFIFKLGK
tara:strand:- start:8253 stop:10223 length:1971 start_codon:yes stop_codon:yes gene_type:complete